MANPGQKALRGSERKLTGARFETKDGIKITKNGKKLLRVNFYAPVNVNDPSEGEVKVVSTLWEKDAERLAKAPKNARVNVSGYEKLGQPWTPNDGSGKTIVSNEFVVTSFEPVAKSAPVQQTVAPVEWSDTDDESDEIPF